MSKIYREHNSWALSCEPNEYMTFEEYVDKRIAELEQQLALLQKAASEVAEHRKRELIDVPALATSIDKMAALLPGEGNGGRSPQVG